MRGVERGRRCLGGRSATRARVRRTPSLGKSERQEWHALECLSDDSQRPLAIPAQPEGHGEIRLHQSVTRVVAQSAPEQRSRSLVVFLLDSELTQLGEGRRGRAAVMDRRPESVRRQSQASCSAINYSCRVACLRIEGVASQGASDG